MSLSLVICDYHEDELMDVGVVCSVVGGRDLLFFKNFNFCDKKGFCKLCNVVNKPFVESFQSQISKF